MQTNHFPPRMEAPRLVRRIWSEFEGWAAEQRANLERECDKIDAKLRATPTWSRAKESTDPRKAKEIREAKDRYITSVRVEWQKRLDASRLRDADWGPMTVAEIQRVEIVLGGDLDEHATVTQIAFTKPPQEPQPSSSVPLTNPTLASAPPLSATARTHNSSTSTDYSFVDPSDFTTDDELFEAVSSYITIPTDDSEMEEPISIMDPELWGLTRSGLRDRSSNHSSQSPSPTRHSSASSNNYNFGPYPSSHAKPELNSAPLKRPSDVDRPSKVHLRGPSYVGPSLRDPDETSDEEADFERFKMETRIRKIWEFHHAAALADVELAMTIYNDRVTKKSAKADDVLKVAVHEKQMIKLQAEKEEERKAMVNAELKKRRDEIRRRTVLRESGANGIDVNGINHMFENFFNNQSARIDIDMNGQVVHRKDDLPASVSLTEDHPWGNILSQPEIAATMTPAPPGQVETLRGRPPVGRATPSGWKAKQVPSALSIWQSTPTPGTTGDDLFAHSSASAHEDWGGRGDEHLQLPGGFADEATDTPVPHIPNGWGMKKPVGASKLAQVETAPSPPSPEILSADTPVLSSTAKKSNKKQRLVNQKKGTLAPAMTTTAEVEAESPLTPTATAKVPHMAHLKMANTDEESPSTPRPNLFAAHMKRSNGLMSDYMSDTAPTPRMISKRLDAQLPSHGTTLKSSLDASEETPWQRMQRLGTLPVSHTPMTKSGPSEVEDRSTLTPIMKPKVQPMMDSRLSSQLRPSPLSGPAGKEEEEGSVWGRTVKVKMQTTQSSLGDARQRVPGGNLSKNSSMAIPAPVLGLDGGETMWEQTSKGKGKVADTPVSISIKNNTQPSDLEGGALWQRMVRLNAQNTNLGNVGGTLPKTMFDHTSNAASAVEEETPWQRMQRLKTQAANVASTAPVKNPSTAAPEDETPWQRMARLKAETANSATSGATSSRTTLDQMATPTSTKRVPVKSNWGFPGNFDAPVSKVAEQQIQPASSTGATDLFWSQVGAGSNSGKQAMRSSTARNRSGSILTDSKAKVDSGVGKKVTIEDVPDEEGPNGWKKPDERLPSDSRLILDIVEPKPSVPPTMFTNIFQYGGESEEDYDTGRSSAVPTPSTAPTSPPRDEVIDEKWYVSAMEEMGKGNWDSLLRKSGPPPGDEISKPTEQGLMPGSQMEQSPLSQTIDGATLVSALEDIDEHPSAVGVSPPGTVKSSPPAEPPAAEKTERIPPKAGPAKEVKGGKGKKGKGRK